MRLRPKIYEEIDFDSTESSERARKILREKKCLRDIYTETYREMMAIKNHYLVAGGIIVEIGSGGGFIKEIFPEIITSDVKTLSGVDMVFTAEKLPFADHSISALFALHVLHHIPDVTAFLREAERVLVPGGGIVCVEPYWSPVARFVYRHIHFEPYDEHAPNWLVQSGHPGSSSNQALSYLLLKRDREQFRKLFPHFKVVYDRPFGFIRYMATGGIWVAPMLPGIVFTLLKYIEYALQPLMPLVGISHMFVWKKVS